MQIKAKERKPIPFNNLECGDVFWWYGNSGEYWLRIENTNAKNAVNLRTGKVVNFEFNEPVFKIQGYFAIEKEDN